MISNQLQLYKDRLQTIDKNNNRMIYDAWLDQIFRLRFKVYSRIGVIDPIEYPDRKVVDKYDKLSTTLHFVIIEETIVVATGRLVLMSKIGLSTDREFPLDYYLVNIGKTYDESYPFADGSRLVVDPKCRNKNYGTYLQYIVPKYAFDSLGINYIFSVGNPDYSGTFAVGCKQIGDPVEYQISSKATTEKTFHKAVPMYLTNELLMQPKGLLHHHDSCFILKC